MNRLSSKKLNVSLLALISLSVLNFHSICSAKPSAKTEKELSSEVKTSQDNKTSKTPASDFLKSQVAEVLKLTALPVQDENTKAKIDAQLLAVIKPMMDFPAMSQASLDQHWDKQSAEQQKKFISLFEELVFHSYMKKIRGAKNDAEVSYEDETARKEGGAEVEAITQTKEMGEVELRFILRAGQKAKNEALFVAEDVVIDEVSLVNNYREEFNKMITKEGFEGLLKKMETQINKVK